MTVTVSETGPTGIDVAVEIGHPSARHRSVTALLDERAEAAPDAVAASFPAGEVTYAELRDRTVEVARRLQAAGIEAGDRVGVLLAEASVDYLSHTLAPLRLGAVMVPINARNKALELAHVVEHSGMALLVTEESFESVVAESGASCRVVTPGDPAFVEPGRGVPDAELARIERRVGRDEVAQIIYTSGTTGLPKGCLHTHATLLAEGENCATRLEMTAADRFWTPLPLFHCGGWQAYLAALSRGACFSHVGRFDGARALRQLVDERCTHAFPAFELIWTDVLGQPGFADEDLSALRMVMNVGPPERMRQMQAKVPHAVQVSSMGSTESCGSICIGGPRDPLESRIATSGAPLPGAELRVVDTATGEPVTAGGVGELQFRGVTLFAGYYRDERATRSSLTDDGWFASGDLVRLEDHGGVAFVSRLKDMLKVGGENVAAGEIEGYLVTHPAIAQVAVVGAPDARYGEVPVAYVQVEPGATLDPDDVVAYCLGRIASYKVPRYVRIVDAFPVTASQKVQKVTLRQMIADELLAAGIDEAPRLPRTTA
ncbi:MAG: acyl--CoA ligase [Solirubrobacteraceae bacterium]|nr:acyl--CoA ligase [Solirubrobacteraceae bacterium]